MYDYNRFCELRANTTKTVRFDDYTLNVINSYKGRNFSERLRKYVYDAEHGMKKDVNIECCCWLCSSKNVRQ